MIRFRHKNVKANIEVRLVSLKIFKENPDKSVSNAFDKD